MTKKQDSLIKQYLKLCRPKNWLKNIFVFLPIVFAMQLLNYTKLIDTILAFIAFCLIASAIYIQNDIKDISKDQAHPVKCKRPLASGRVSVKSAIYLMAILAILSLGISIYINIYIVILVLAYIAINILYTHILTNMAIVDCFCIATGFIIRVFAGSFASGDAVSDWLFLTIVAMSLFMAFGKRRGELIKTNGDSRSVLKIYDIVFLNGIVFMCAGLTIVFYSLWTMLRGADMIYTVPLIIYIISKYLILIYFDSHADPTTVILGNKTLIIACLIYASLTVFLLYKGAVL
jgi:4-hydroxybenzoate polyprenyltransferase